VADGFLQFVDTRLKQIAAAGAIVVLATHDLDLAEGLITRMAIVRNGRLIADATATPQLRQQYRAQVEAA
jgi:ABC-type multidrug transport system ATPase subunit